MTRESQVPEQHGSKDVQVSPSRWQQNLPATPATTVWSHLSVLQHFFEERQVRPNGLQRLAAAPRGVVTIISDARLAAPARPKRRRVQASNRGASMVASIARVASLVRDECTLPAFPGERSLTLPTRYLDL
jgi:hypothetical protein